MELPTTIATLAALVGLVVVVFSRVKDRPRAPYPPHPKDLPFVGNLFAVPAKRAWITYKEWGLKWNTDIVSIRVFNTRVVIVNTLEAAQELFETRGAIYSSRPSYPMAELAGHTNWDLGWLPDGKRWRDHRKVFHQEFERDTPAHRPHEVAATRRLLKKLHEKPKGFMKHLRHAAGDMIISATYGIQILPEGDPLVDLAEEVVRGIGRSVEPFLVNSFPILKHVPSWLPGTGFLKLAAAWKQDSHNLIEGPFELVRQKMKEGIAAACVTSRALDALEDKKQHDPEGYKYDVEVLANVLAMVFIGAADTLVPALNAFVLYMVMNPEVQRKAHAAIDEVTHRKYIPDFSDYGQVPYIDALMNEVFRCSAVVPLGVPHFSTADDVYKGYFIPKDTIMMGNTWAILHDEKTYGPDVDVFRPERFLGPDGKRNDLPDPEAFFGYGRRICPGRSMAREAIWCIIISMLSVFEINEAIDENGKPIKVTGEFTSAFVCHPVPFECSIKPRFTEAVELIQLSVDA